MITFNFLSRNKKKCAQDEERAAIVKANGSAKETKVEDGENGTEEDKINTSVSVPNGAEVVDAQC